jgi:hypothetical protein
VSDYHLLSIPPGFRGPSGEQHQIQVAGLVTRIRLFHGKSDEEFDWHVHLRLDAADAGRIGQFLRDHGESVSNGKIAELYSELMVIDDWHRRSVTWPPWQASFQRKYDTADLTHPLRLQKAGSAHPAHDLAENAADEPGDTKDLSGSSLLVSQRGRVYMQGLLVLDVGHDDPSVEIHPPDSIAFALDDSGRVLTVPEGQAGWPTRGIRWRVAWFGNSTHHRVNDESPLQQQRTTTWYLPLPGEAAADTSAPIDITSESLRLWDSKNDEWYYTRGVSTLEVARPAIDPRDGRRRLRLSATMKVPGERGGIVVRDYLVRARGADSGPAVTAGGPHALDVFVRGKNDELVHRYFDGAGWSGWINLGGDLASAPAVTAGGPGVPSELQVFVRGKHNDELVLRYWDGRQWSGWINLGGDLASAPAVTAGGPHALDVFVRGKNDELVHRYFDSGQWSGWINLGGDLA